MLDFSKNIISAIFVINNKQIPERITYLFFFLLGNTLNNILTQKFKKNTQM